MTKFQNISGFAAAFAVIVVLVLASSARALFIETFDGGAFSDGGTIVGNNGWVSGGFRGSNSHPRPSSQLSSAPSEPTGSNSGLSAVSAGGDPGDAFARDISGDIVNNQIELSFDVGGSGHTRVNFGAADNILNGGGTNNYTHFAFQTNDNRINFSGESQPGEVRAPEIETTVAAVAGNDYRARIRLNTATGETTVDYRLEPTDPWTTVHNENVITGSAGWTWTGNITAVSFNQQFGGWVDNITIGVVPEPASFSLLSLGALMMMMRRRRSA